MYQLMLIGHGGFPSGMKSALRHLMGKNGRISVIELDEGSDHAQFEKKLDEFLQANDRVLVLADLTGGAPHQIAAKLTMENRYSGEHFLVSGMPLSTVLELCMKFQFQDVRPDEAEGFIREAVAESKELITIHSAGK